MHYLQQILMQQEQRVLSSFFPLVFEFDGAKSVHDSIRRSDISRCWGGKASSKWMWRCIRAEGID
jgi:hypothetical protein